MKTRHILMNLLPLPLWILCYVSTSLNEELFMTSPNDIISLIIILAFTVYNLFSEKLLHFLKRNLVAVISLVLGCLISGQIYLKSGYHMSDEYVAVNLISLDVAFCGLAITAIACVIHHFITRKK